MTAAPPVAPPTTAPPVVRSVFDTGVATPHDHDDGLWLSWSLADSAGDRRVGSANSSTERTNAESSMKAWITTDFLRVAGDRGRTVRASDRADIDAAIRRSDDDAAERLYRRLGADQVLRDLNSVCGVAVTTAKRGYWSYAQITATDATTILDCVLDKAPSYPGGDEIVTDLRSVEPDDAFGIPAGTARRDDVRGEERVDGAFGDREVERRLRGGVGPLHPRRAAPVPDRAEARLRRDECAAMSPTPCSPASPERW